MATTAQLAANGANARRLTGHRMETPRSVTSGNSIRNGLFTAYEHLAPSDIARIDKHIESLRASVPVMSVNAEYVIRRYAIAKWRNEEFCKIEVAFLNSAVAEERKSPEYATLAEKPTGYKLEGRAIARNAATSNAYLKMEEQGSRVTRELLHALKAYGDLVYFVREQ
jgi:hypothetical protein